MYNIVSHLGLQSPTLNLLDLRISSSRKWGHACEVPISLVSTILWTVDLFWHPPYFSLHPLPNLVLHKIKMSNDGIK